MSRYLRLVLVALAVALTSCVGVSLSASVAKALPPPTCTAGSENFSEDADGSQPTTFSGGTIDTAYGLNGGIRVQGSSWGGTFPDGTHLLFTGDDVPNDTPFQLS